MKTKQIYCQLWLLLGSLFIAGLGWAVPPTRVDWDNPVFTEEYVPGELLIGYKQDAVAASIQTVHQQLGAKVLGQFSITPLSHIRLPKRLSMAEAAKQYLANPAVAYVEPNYIFRLCAVPNDPLYGDLWGMERIQAPKAWDITTGNQEIAVGVIDTGIFTTHQDLVANIAPGGYDFINGDADPMDDQGHGSHVAGTIGAVGNNSIGVVGVNWQVKLIGLKIFNADGKTSAGAIIGAVQYAATNTALKIKITNNSWGGGGYSQGLYDAIKQAGETYGQLFIAAAGNEGLDNDETPHYPSSYDLPNIIAVAAIGEDGSLADFSCYGLESVDLAAPGVDILSTVPGGAGDQYDGTYSGTSMACPHVAGAAALLWGLNPNYTYQEIRDAILESVVLNSNLAGKMVTGGELDLYAAIAALGPQLTLDRLAYQSDATVHVTVNDPTLTAPLPTDVNVDVEVLDSSDVVRWGSTEMLPAVVTNGSSFAGSFNLVSGTTAVEGDTLTVTYANPGGKASTVSAPIDDTPPIIANVHLAGVTEDLATVRWYTDEPADSRYVIAKEILPGGLAALLPEIGGGVYVTTPVVIDGSTQYVHEVAIPVEGSTKYFVAVLSEDYAGNKTSSPTDLTSTNEDDYLSFITQIRRVVYENDMESGTAGWTVTNLNGAVCWQNGIPTFGPPGAVSGERVWGTILDGNYPHLAQASLSSTPVEVKLSPRLEFQSWHRFATGDFGAVEVNAGAGWINVTSKSTISANVLEGSSSGWQLVTVDLSDFSNKTIRVRFRIESNAQDTAAGWYIDDVRISNILPPGINIIGYSIDDAAPRGDGDGHPEPGESFFLNLEVFNSTQTQTFSNVQASVTVPTPEVVLTPSTAQVLYGNLGSGDNAFSGTQLPLSTAADVPLGTRFTVFHSATDEGGHGPFVDTLTLEIVSRESVFGMVTNLFTGDPIATAWVRGQAPEYPDVLAYTDLDGSYALHGLVPGVIYSVQALKPGEYSPCDPTSLTGPSSASFGLGQAYANPDPLSFDFAVDEGGWVEDVLNLDNSVGNLPLSYEVAVDYLPHPSMTEVPIWLEIDPSIGVISAGDGEIVELFADASVLIPSEQPYEAVLRLISNDIGGEDILIPVTLAVAASSTLYVHSVRVEGGDDDPFAEPGETLDLDILLGNSGSLIANELAGVVSYADASATTVNQSNVFWKYVSPGGVANPMVDPLADPPSALPSITLDPALSDGDVVFFDLEITDLDARVTSLSFSLTVTVRRTISGTVSDLLTADPVEGALVKAVGGGFAGQAFTDAAGKYNIYGLTNGTYEVYVLPPAPYGAPPSVDVAIANADAANVNFAVAEWRVSATPNPIVVNLREGMETNLMLSVKNEGAYNGFVELGIELVQGIPHDRIGDVVVSETDWAALAVDAYIQGEMLVRFEDGSGIQAQSSALSAVGAQVVRRFDLVPAALIRVPGNLSMQSIANTLTANASIRYVEPNYRRKPFAVPNDPFYGEMYGLENTRQTGGTLGADIRAFNAWDTTVGSTGVVIAVMDTGVKLDHPDLEANLVPGYDFGDDDDDPSPDPVADAEHGTHVAGTIGAVGNNQIGVAGVNWNSKIMPLKVATVEVDPITGMEAIGLSAAAIVDALNYAVTNNVKISNHSYGGPDFSGVEYETIAAAMAHDHLFVSAAGNDTLNNDIYPSYPASYNLDNILSVAATDHDGLLADFSNFGEQTVDIAAPGVDILSTYLDISTMESTYESISGTSMASPHVAGVAGLLKSIAPWATYAMLRDAIILGSRRDPVLEGVVASSGHLDAAAALERIKAFWVQLDIMKGNIPSLGTLPVNVVINAGGQLPAGTYIAHIVVRGGANELVVPVTVNVAAAPFPVITKVDVVDGTAGDGDSHAEPGETVDLFIEIYNDGSVLYASPTGTVSSATPGVTILQGTSIWPGISSGDQKTNATSFRATMPNVEGDVEFNLTLLHPTRGPWVLSFTIPVVLRHTISGTVRDAQTAAGLGGLVVEFWGVSSGRVLTESNGLYRLDGLENGTYRVRVLGKTHEKSVVEIRTVADGNQTANFNLRRPEISLSPTQLVFAAQTGQDQEQELVLTNSSADIFEYTILVAKPRKIGLISDRNALAPVKPVLEQMGWEVSMWSNNLATVDGVLTGRHTTDEEVVLTQDLVVLDLGGTVGTGRLLSVAEDALLKTYLDKGGKVVVVGANVLSQPDDRRMRDLVGSDSLDRSEMSGGVALLNNSLPIDPFWAEIMVGDLVAVDTMAYDEATPDVEANVETYFEVDGASKIMRRVTDAGGVVILWNGNKNAGEWQQRGVWQDVLQGLVESELLESVPWLSVSPTNATIASGTLPVTVKAESANLAIGTHRAMLILRGNYPGLDARVVPVTFDVVTPTLRAQSTTGVKDWMNRYLSGTGGANASLFQLVNAGPDGIINPPMVDGSATGDDVVLFTFPFNKNHGRIGVGFEWLPELGRFNEIFQHDLLATTPVRNVYVRAWDAAAFEDAVAYGDSGLYALDLSANETHDFGTWVVDRVLDYPGSMAGLRDSNGDSVPDGYYIQIGMDPRAPVAPLSPEWNLLAKAGSFGTASNQFRFPSRLFLTDSLVFVLDRQNNRISVWNRETLANVRNFGSGGTGNGQFATPYGLGKDPNANRFAVADSANHRIQVFTFDPTNGVIAFERQFGSYGAGAGQFNNPRDVAIGPLGRFHVADMDNHRVQVFDPSGNHLFSFGAFGTANGQMKSPQGIAVDEDGIIYVADTDNHRIQGFTGSGSFLWKTGTAGSGLGQFNKPMGIQIGLGQRLYVADTSNHRIQVLSASRTPVGTLGEQGGGDGQLNFPHDVAPSFTSDVVYVADTWNHRLLKMETTLDGDGDGMDDSYELLNNLNPSDPQDALTDTDGDGLLNIGEYRLQTNPLILDTDGDISTDAQEVASGTNPLDPLDYPALVYVTGSMPFSLRWMGTNGGVYGVQASSNLSSGVWFPVPESVFTATVNGVVGFTNTLPNPLLLFRPVRYP